MKTSNKKEQVVYSHMTLDPDANISSYTGVPSIIVADGNSISHTQRGGLHHRGATVGGGYDDEM